MMEFMYLVFTCMPGESSLQLATEKETLRAVCQELATEGKKCPGVVPLKETV